MRKFLAMAALALGAGGGCYLIAPIPGGYVGIDIPPVSVEVRGGTEISWSIIPGTTIYYSPALPDVLYYNGRYYYEVNGAWYVGTSYLGPWYAVRVVPDVFLYIPPSHPAYRVVRWHPKYRYYHRPAPGVYYVRPQKSARPSGIPVVPKKGKKGKQENKTPPPAPPVWRRR